jgi:hypothetical protein
MSRSQITRSMQASLIGDTAGDGVLLLASDQNRGATTDVYRMVQALGSSCNPLALPVVAASPHAAAVLPRGSAPRSLPANQYRMGANPTKHRLPPPCLGSLLRELCGCALAMDKVPGPARTARQLLGCLLAQTRTLRCAVGIVHVASGR